MLPAQMSTPPRTATRCATTAFAAQFTLSILLLLLVPGNGLEGQSPPTPAYSEAEVTFESDGVTIAGVVTIPDGDGPHPALVLVDGSGATDRSNMRDFAGVFAEAGYATLSYDKRGVGESTGDPDAWARFDIADLAADAAAGADLLAARPGVDAGRVGILGISQGGWVAPHAATLTDRISFMILLSPSVTTIADDRIFERAARLRAEGFTSDEVGEAREMQVLYHEVVRTGESFGRFEAAWREHEDTRWFRRVFPSDALLDPTHRYHAWLGSVLDYDPVPRLEALDIPVLWLFGDPEHDRLAPVERSIREVARLWREGKEYTVHQFPGTDHGIRPVDPDPDVDDYFPPYGPPLLTWLTRMAER